MISISRMNCPHGMISPFTALGIEGAKGNLSESLASPRASWLRGGGGGAGRTEQSVVFSPRQLISTSSAEAKISQYTTNNANLAGDDAGDDVYCIPKWSASFMVKGQARQDRRSGIISSSAPRSCPIDIDARPFQPRPHSTEPIPTSPTTPPCWTTATGI